MKNYDVDILIKSFLALFIAYNGITKSINPNYIIILVLCYIAIIYLDKIIIDNKNIKKIFSLFQIIILCLIFKEGDILALGIFSVDVFTILIRKKLLLLSYVYILVLGFYFNSYNNNEILILTLVLVFILISSNEKEIEKIKVLERLETEQRNKIKNLNNKILKEKEYREQILRTSILEERNKISARLHDKIGHVISGTLLQLEATKIIMENNSEKAEGVIDKAINNLRLGMDDIRMTLRSIRPKEEELSINRLKNLLEDKLNNTNIEGKVVFTGNLNKITTEMWILFLNALIESSTNSIKYSKCSVLEANISVLNKMVKFEIKDDGIGCSKIEKGIGLSSMEEKVRELKGKIIFNGERGFSIIILINLD